MRTTSHPSIGLPALNTLMLACTLMWFVAQQNGLAPSAHKYGLADVTKAKHLQPRTPPPLLDPEQIDINVQEAETHWDFWPHH